MIAQTGKTFGKLPSELLGIKHDAIALDFDIACGVLLKQKENRRDLLRLDAQRHITRQAVAEANGVIEIAPPLSFDDEKEDSEIDGY